MGEFERLGKSSYRILSLLSCWVEENGGESLKLHQQQNSEKKINMVSTTVQINNRNGGKNAQFKVTYNKQLPTTKTYLDTGVVILRAVHLGNDNWRDILQGCSQFVVLRLQRFTMATPWGIDLQTNKHQLWWYCGSTSWKFHGSQHMRIGYEKVPWYKMNDNSKSIILKVLNLP